MKARAHAHTVELGNEEAHARTLSLSQGSWGMEAHARTHVHTRARYGVGEGNTQQPGLPVHTSEGGGI